MSRETLLQRLRQYEGAQWETTACYNGLRDEAADEIDRLRDMATVKASLRWRDENDRLREALVNLRETIVATSGGPDDSGECYYTDLIDAALASEREGQ